MRSKESVIYPKIHDLQYQNKSFDELCLKGHLECIKYLLDIDDYSRYVIDIDSFLNACRSNNVELLEFILARISLTNDDYIEG